MTSEPPPPASSEGVPFYHLATPKPPEKEQDLIKISAIVFAVVGGILAALGALCIAGIFPSALFGGTVGIIVLISAGIITLIPSALIIYCRWSH